MPVVPASAPAGRPHLYWIDWLRFLAAATVLLDHVCDANWFGQNVAVDPRHKTLLTFLTAPIHLGREAVVVFFVLSGTLVGGLTLRKMRDGTFDAAGYAADRLARVYVPLVPALLLTAASVRMLDDPMAPLQYLGCLLGLQGVVTHHPYANGPLWSLSYEIWFYVLAGCVAVAAGGRGRTGRVRRLAWEIGALTLGILCFRLQWTYFACWLLGAAGMGLSERIAKPARPWAMLAGVALMFAGVAGFRPDLLALVPLLGLLSGWSWLDQAATLTLGAGTLLLVASICRSVPASPTGARIERLGTTLAAFSYTLYLTHMPILRVFASTSARLPELVTWYALFRLTWWAAACLAVAWVMYVLFEKQTPRVRRWLRAHFDGTARDRAARDRPALAAQA